MNMANLACDMIALCCCYLVMVYHLATTTARIVLTWSTLMCSSYQHDCTWNIAMFQVYKQYNISTC